MKILIENDILDIVSRLRRIDESYFVLYDTGKGKFELHSEAQDNTYCLTFPFNCLDERAVDMALSTRREKLEEIFANMERQNERLIKTGQLS